MGKLFAGPFCDLTGKTGNNVGRWVKGKNIFAIKPHKSSVPPTQLMLDQRFKFGLITSWVSRISKLVKPGFDDYDAGMTPVNACVGYNLKHAITGVSPNFSIDYSKVLYSRGKLDLPNSPEIDITVAAKLDYSWLAVTGDTNAKPTDKVTFMVYNPDKDKFVTLQGAAVRSALAYSLQLPGNFSGDTVEAYFSMASADGKMVSDSVYVGSFIVL
ncbi:hypothetical protein HDC92_000931 [Pedobacter sp. AK017]|uniref:DUF6266 family protein n=1 Tax=Pedobacter sp. AK017 TaxID=2723073 RepID=UPI00161D7F4F|nr:DUF6266 family protein [Pedobacter sp. AK017]MBB5437263.1 hypothetical protein [Pedobacter sp. AK017]